MLHPGTWYGFAQWPELNATIVGGGARGHDRIAAFSVNAVKPEHPIMKGVPASFEVEDELYYLNAEAEKVPPGTAAIEVLAETSPSVQVQEAASGGLDHEPSDRAHRRHHARPRPARARSRAFKTLLVNAVTVGRARSREPLASDGPADIALEAT